MTLIEVAVIVMAIALVAVACALIPTLQEIKKTAMTARSFLERTETELTPLIAETKAAVAEVKTMTATVAKGGENLKALFEAAGDTSQKLHTISSVINGISGVVSSSSLWMTGAKVAGKFIIDQIKQRKQQRKGGSEHGE